MVEHGAAERLAEQGLMDVVLQDNDRAVELIAGDPIGAQLIRRVRLRGDYTEPKYSCPELFDKRSALCVCNILCSGMLMDSRASMSSRASAMPSLI